VHGLEPTQRLRDSYTASVIPGAKLSIYGGIGYSPFYENPARVNRVLAAFVRMANKAN
jgi:non-heme chloroperoxidase